MPLGFSYIGGGAIGASSLEADPPLVLVPTVLSVEVSPDSVSLAGGGVQQFYALVEVENGASQEVTWSVSLGTVSINGLVAPPEATYEIQTGYVFATSKFDPTKTGVATFTIPAIPIAPNPDGIIGSVKYTSIPRSKLKAVRIRIV